jgi:hypothetical protein
MLRRTAVCRIIPPRAGPKPAGQLPAGDVHRMHGVFCMVDMMRELEMLL